MVIYHLYFVPIPYSGQSLHGATPAFIDASFPTFTSWPINFVRRHWSSQAALRMGTDSPVAGGNQDALKLSRRHHAIHVPNDTL